MAAAVVLALSVGSDTGIKVSTYAFPLLVPATLGVLGRISGTPFRGASAASPVHRSWLSWLSLDPFPFSQPCGAFTGTRPA